MAGDAQANLDFYAGVLGMRLVKKSVNQDDPGTYHLFYADGEGAPGSDLTFFPWGKDAARGSTGAGMASEVALAVSNGSLGFWHKRLEHYGINSTYETRFGEYALAFQDHRYTDLLTCEIYKALTLICFTIVLFLLYKKEDTPYMQ